MEQNGACLTDLVWDRANRDPKGLALVELGNDRDAAMTWRDLVDGAEQAASVLIDIGVQPSENVMMQLPNSADLIVMVLATLRIGAVCAPVSTALRQRELGYVLQRSRARVLAVPEEFRERSYGQDVLSMARGGETPLLAHLLVTRENRSTGTAWIGSAGTCDALVTHDLPDRMAAAEAAGGDVRMRSLGLDAIAHLLFTSGTTGEPKGVPHRMGTLNRAVSLMSSRLGLTEHDRLKVASPMTHHSGFLYGMWLALYLGAVQIVQPVWDADRALKAFEDWQSTFMLGAPPFLMDLVTAVEAGGVAPRSLKTFVITGAPVPRELANRTRTLLGTQVCAAWGSTESCMGSLSAPDDDPNEVAATDGRPLDGVQFRVTDDAGDVLETGREGNLEVVSPLLFEGYLNRPDLTAEAFTADGWYRTGDLAVVDSNGYLRITGRAKDVINRGGEKIPVGEVEQLLLAHPVVRDAAVVAMPDARLGERSCLFAVLEPGATLDLSEVRCYLAKLHVTKLYWPEHLELIDTLPRNLSGKVQKYILRERAARETGKKAISDPPTTNYVVE